MGSRVISEVSNIMFGEFTKNFQAQLAQPEVLPMRRADGSCQTASAPLLWPGRRRKVCFAAVPDGPSLAIE